MKRPEDMTDQELDFAIVEAEKKVPKKPEEMTDEELDQSIAALEVLHKTPEKKPIEAFTKGIGNSVTFGYAPELNAAIEGLLTPPSVAQAIEQNKKLGIEEPKGPNFEERTKKYRAEQNQLFKENPEAATSGKLLGTVSSAILGTKALGLSAKAAQAMQAMNASKNLTSFAAPAIESAIEGFAYNPKETGMSRAEGAASGALGSVIGTGIGKSALYAGDKIAEAGKGFLRRAIGVQTPEFKKQTISGLNPDDVADFAYQKGIFKKGLDADQMHNQALSIQSDIGKKIGEISKTAEGKIPKFDTGEIADDVINRIAKEVKGTSGGIEIEKMARNEMENFLNKENKIPLTELDDYRKQLQTQILKIGKNIDVDSSKAVQAKNLIREKLNDVLLDTVEKTGGAEKKAELLALKNEYRKALAVSDSTFNLLAKERGLNMLPLRGAMGIAESIGSITDPFGIPGAIAKGLIMPAATSKTATKMAAVAAPGISEISKKTGKGLMKASQSAGLLGPYSLRPEE